MVTRRLIEQSRLLSITLEQSSTVVKNDNIQNDTQYNWDEMKKKLNQFTPPSVKNLRNSQLIITTHRLIINI